MSTIMVPNHLHQVISPALMNAGHYSLSRFSPQGFAYLLCFLVCFSSNSAIAQQHKEADPLASLYKVKKVKTVTAWQPGTVPTEQVKAYHREYNAAGNMIFEIVYDENGAVVKKYQSFYSTDNRLLKEVWTQDETDSVVYRYKNGQLTDETWYWGADNSKTRVVHFFDTLSRKVCSVSKNAWGVYVDSFFYENGRLHQTKNYNEHGQFTSLTEHVYDSKGRLQKTVLQDDNGTVMQQKTRMYWETGPLKSSETVLYSTNSKYTTPPVSASMAENFKYDALKQLKEVSMSSYTNNELLVNSKITYTYNETGLPISQSSVNLVTNIKQVLKFTYSYF